MLHATSRCVGLALVLAAAGCAHSNVNREKLTAVKRIGVLAVVIDRVAPTPGDEAVLRAAADRAVAVYEGGLGRSGRFEVVPVATYRADPEFAAMSDVVRSSLVRAEVKKLADAGKIQFADEQLAAVLSMFKKKDPNAPPEPPKPDKVERATQQIKGVIEKQRGNYVAAGGMPAFPYTALDPRKDSSSMSGPKKEPQYPEMVRDVLRASVGALAAKLGLDAMAVVYLRSQVLATVGVNVISGNRGNDTIRMEPAILLIGRDGEAVVDLEAKTIDAISPSRAAVPVYRVDWSPSGDHVLSGKRFSLVLDLADPKGEVRSEYQALVEKSASGFLDRFEKSLVPN